MDAAEYINTFENLGLETRPASTPRFAIVDLAVDESFLNQLYGSMNGQTIEWSSLLANSRWEKAWRSGPILIDISDHKDFTQALSKSLESKPLGLLVETSMNFEVAQTYFGSMLLCMAGDDASLFRFYEPRMLGALMAALGDKRQRVVRAGEKWSWHDGWKWQTYRNPESGTDDLSGSAPALSRHDLVNIPQYRAADRAIRLHEIYQSNLTAESTPRLWIMERLAEARDAGIATASGQERWLRLALQHGASFQKTPPFEKVMHDPSMTPQERLMAMESLSESSHAAVSG
ncbi:DUF4123 domain-containing protein [Marinobacter mangrovi]|uniref:DUF4123 domain-containing protein n=1 Tax=Marinobacter mangrovi TaxID=2803918 RepID=UPI001931C7D8|nr:DUF4123 domain-containing protein [Marinobacter mangrovi]